MNKDMLALIERIDIDEHLEYYQKLTYAQRARLMSGLFSFSRSVRRNVTIEQATQKLAEKKFTPAMCRKFLKQISSSER
jgi:hypothetical protein